MRAWVLAALICMAGAAHAEDRVQRPPARYRGDSWAIVRWVDITKVDRACREMGATTGPYTWIQGCTLGRNMILPNPCLFMGFLADLFCHEVGHVNGWPANHKAEAPTPGEGPRDPA